MKSSILWIPLLAASLSATASPPPPPSPADAPTDQPAAPHHGEMRERFRKADANGDGRLSSAEAQALPRLAKHFEQIDANHDGFVTRDEMRAAHDQMRDKREQHKDAKAAGDGQPPADPAEDDNN